MQRAVEGRGIPTVSVSVARDVTARINPPRAVYVPFMMGHHFGVPGHVALQRRILLEMLDHLERATVSGQIRDIPVTWAQARREGMALEGER